MFQKLSVVLACLLLLSVTPVIAQTTTTIPIPMFCEGNFDCDEDVDGTDAATFKSDFGRSSFQNPCSYLNDCPAPWSPCPEGMLVCGWACVDPMTDEDNCGGCNVTCSETCLSGVCQQGITAPLGKTGQTISYATGDDGNLEKGIEWPTPRFTDNADGTITDNLTRLIWLKNAGCFNTTTWFNALLDCNTLANGSCGLTDGSSSGDWRLPNYKELLSLVDVETEAPVLPSEHPFNNVQSFYYWTSTTYYYFTGDAWFVGMDDGNLDYDTKNNLYHVWPVRNGNQDTTTSTISTTTTTSTISPFCDETTDCGEGNCCGYASGQELWSGNPLYCTSKVNETICFFCTSSSDCAYSTDNPCCCSECDDLGLGFAASICWHPTPCGIGCGGTCLP